MTPTPHVWSAVRPEAWAAIAVALALAAAALLAARRARPPWRRVLLAVAVFVLLRAALFGNPLVWEAYARILSPEGVGWRQYDVVTIRRDRFFRPEAGPRFLAVGSSQTGRIYDAVARERDDLATFVVAGMTPVDLVLYRDAIADREPGCVLLYLSDFDVARGVPATAVATAPRQGLAVFRIAATLRGLPGGREFRTAIAELLLGEVSPEAKYGFVLRGLVDEGFRQVASRLAPPDPGGSRASLEQRVEWLRESYDERFLEPNLRQVESFVTFARARGIEVAIVEGRVRPSARDDRMRRLERETRAALEGLAARTDGVRYVASDDVLALEDRDFEDLTHVHDEVGVRFARRVLDRLEGRPAASDDNPAAWPVRRDERWWRERVRAIEDRVAAAPPGGIVLVGDSITAGWEREGAAAWRAAFPGREAINLGVSSDRTEHVLWRLRRLDLERLRPDVAVVLVGTNNAVRPAQGAVEIAGGVEAVVDEIARRSPATEVLVFAIFPRGTAEDPARDSIVEANRRLAALLAGRDRVRFVDVAAAFLAPDGDVRRDLLPDRLHPSATGYGLWADAIARALAADRRLPGAEGTPIIGPGSDAGGSR